jgi:hypothetical protein
METNTNFLSYRAKSLLIMRNVSDKKKIKTHILGSTTFLENRAVYEIMWKNIVQPDRPQMTIWRMRIACRITKATDTIFNTYCFSTATVVTRTHLNLTLCVKYIACLVLPQCLLNDTIFGKKKLLNIKRVFRVSL